MPALASIQVPQAAQQPGKDYRLATLEYERFHAGFIKRVARGRNGKYLEIQLSLTQLLSLKLGIIQTLTV